jgi:hypothetical protein
MIAAHKGTFRPPYSSRRRDGGTEGSYVRGINFMRSLTSFLILLLLYCWGCVGRFSNLVPSEPHLTPPRAVVVSELEYINKSDPVLCYKVKPKYIRPWEGKTSSS